MITKTKNKRLSFCVLFVALLMLFTSMVNVLPAKAITLDLGENERLLFAAEEGGYTLEDSTLTKVANKSVLSNTADNVSVNLSYASTQKDINGKTATLNNYDNMKTELVSNGAVFRFGTATGDGANAISQTVVFKEPVNLKTAPLLTSSVFILS